MAKELKTRIVLRNDSTANWTAQDPVLMKGEIGFDMDLLIFKVGDGVKKWSELTKQFKSYEDTIAEVKTLLAGLHTAVTYQTEVDLGANKEAALEAVAGEAQQGDIGIVKERLADGKFQYTAYVHTGEGWAAMDGNYDAENVYFQKDLTITAAIGVQTIPSSGSKTLATTGKNVKQVFDMLCAEEKNPTITQPTVSLDSSNIGAKEVGTNIAIAYAFNTDKGKYSYGPATGVVAGTVTASFDGQTKTGATGTFDNVVADGTKTLSVSITHNEGAVPNTNLGNPYADGKITAGTKTATASQTLVGVRYMFWGPVTTDIELNSANIRALGHKEASASKTLGTFGAGAGAKKVIVAVPAGKKITKVIMPSALNADVTALFVKQGTQVDVEGAESYAAAKYNVYVYQPASIDAGETYSVTIG